MDVNGNERSVLVPMPRSRFMLDEQFQMYKIAWIQEIVEGLHSLDTLADELYERGSPLSVQQLLDMKAALEMALGADEVPLSSGQDDTLRAQA